MHPSWRSHVGIPWHRRLRSAISFVCCCQRQLNRHRRRLVSSLSWRLQLRRLHHPHLRPSRRVAVWQCGLAMQLPGVAPTQRRQQPQVQRLPMRRRGEAAPFQRRARVAAPLAAHRHWDHVEPALRHLVVTAPREAPPHHRQLRAHVQLLLPRRCRQAVGVAAHVALRRHLPVLARLALPPGLAGRAQTACRCSGRHPPVVQGAALVVAMEVARSHR